METTANHAISWTDHAVKRFRRNKSHYTRDLSHAYLDAYDENDCRRSQLGSCLASLQLFMRHEALWIGEQEGKWEIDRHDWLRKMVSASVVDVILTIDR